MKNVHGLVAATLAAALLTVGGCPFVPGWQRTEDDFGPLTTDFNGVDTIVIDWRTGDVDVVIDPNATKIDASGTKFVRASTEERAAQGLEEIDIQLSTSAAGTVTLSFSAPTATTTGIIYGADLTLVIPGGVDLTVELATGDVTVTGNTGTTYVDVATGNITITDQTGDVSAATATGNTSVDSSAGDVEAASTTGNVTVNARPAENGSIEAGAATGNVTIRVPADFAATLELATNVNGLVSADFTGFTVTDLIRTTFLITATLNDGGGQIEGATATGNVVFEALE